MQRHAIRKTRRMVRFQMTCETFWAVEQFLKEADSEERRDFAEAVRQGDIELSGTYLNMTELADEDLLRHPRQGGGIRAHHRMSRGLGDDRRH